MNGSRTAALGAVFSFMVSAAEVAAHPERAFFTDFDAGVPAQISGVTTLEAPGMLDGYGTVNRRFSGLMLTNHSGGEFDEGNRVPGSPTVITLGGLPAHTSVDLNFLLGIFRTWDSIGDVLRVSVDGRTIFEENFDYLYNERQTYQPPGGRAAHSLRRAPTADTT